MARVRTAAVWSAALALACSPIAGAPAVAVAPTASPPGLDGVPAADAESRADGHFAAGKAFDAPADRAGNAAQRAATYAQAYEELTLAGALYHALRQERPADAALTAKFTECSKLRYAAHQQRRWP